MDVFVDVVGQGSFFISLVLNHTQNDGFPALVAMLVHPGGRNNDALLGCAHLDSRPNHLQASRGALKHRRPRPRLDIFKHQIVIRIAFDPRKPQQRFASFLPEISKPKQKNHVLPTTLDQPKNWRVLQRFDRSRGLPFGRAGVISVSSLQLT